MGITAKDLILYLIGQITTAGGTGHVLEYTGEVIRSLSMEQRMTVCNMSIEAGARAGMIAPDAKTYAYLEGREFAPRGKTFDDAVARWEQLPSGWSHGDLAGVATDSQDRVYVFNRSEHPVIVYDRDGRFLDTWGDLTLYPRPHGITIVNDEVYLVDATDQTVRKTTLDGCRPFLSPHFNLTVELPLKAIIRGYSWTVIPITWRNRRSGVAKLKIKEMGSRYFLIVCYVWLEKYFSRGDYRRRSAT